MATQKTKAELEAEIEVLKAQIEAKPVSATELDGGPDEENLIPAKWKLAVAEILGPEFECQVVQPDNGGTQFKIIVPKELSNASQMHWEMHGRDVRTREIGNTGLVGVKEWCLKVRQNLTASGIKLIQYP